MTGQTISHYRVAEKLGEGATAEVYRADDLLLGREVVLKFFSHDGSRSAAHFQHEARTLSSLNHPNICTIYEIGEHDGRHYLAMERLEGQALSSVLSEQTLTIERLLDIATQVAEALDAAHAEGIVHRDLKPGNIFVTRTGRIKLLDFGVAVLLPRSGGRTIAGPQGVSRAGTIPYMSPEQACGEALDPRSDLFSLGVVLYEMAAGRRPFSAKTADEVLIAIANQAPVAPRQINPTVPGDLERVICKALEKSRTLRYQTALDFRADLQRLKRDLDLASSGMRVPDAIVPSTVSRRVAWWGVAAVIGISAIAGAGWVMFGSAGSRPARSKPTAPPVGANRQSNADAATAGAEGPSVPQRSDTTPVPGSIPEIAASPPRANDAVASTPLSNRGTRDKPSAVNPNARSGEVNPILVAQRLVDLRLYAQALETLQPIAQDPHAPRAVEAAFMMASIADLRADMANAISGYLGIATRFPDHPRAPEALFKLAQSIVKSKRRNSDQDARGTLTDLVNKYPKSTWAPSALLFRAELEARSGAYQRDERFSGAIPTAAATYRQIATDYRRSDSALVALQRLAAIYTDLKRFEAAAATLEELANRDVAGRYDAWFAAAEIFETRLKDHRRAKAAYARVLPVSPHYAEAKRRE